jgi:hypothetical protein
VPSVRSSRRWRDEAGRDCAALSPAQGCPWPCHGAGDRRLARSPPGWPVPATTARPGPSGKPSVGRSGSRSAGTRSTGATCT